MKYETSVNKLVNSNITINSPSPVHGIPYKDLNLKGWIYYDQVGWAQVSDMEYPIGATSQLMYGKTLHGIVICIALLIIEMNLL